ncbi:MAG: hypothetical protein LH650_05735 [Chloroflexi bacterium]|nr:hypothetical protein [Chloroflexota bacterium]
MRRGATSVLLVLVVGFVLASWTGATTLAQYPDASPGAVIVAGDPRSDGGGPGLVGSPIEIALGVVLLGLLTIAGTTLVIKVTRR